jgi:3-deoxy-D-manno-octulosonic-acid transferase
MIRLLYNLFYPVALLFFLPGYLVKMFRRGNYRNKFGQRLGLYDQETRAKFSQNTNTWLHAVSVGEVMIALKLAAEMKRRDPALRAALTTTTTTGFALASRRAPQWIEVLYTPLDFWPVMRLAFAVIRPSQIVLVEAEIWPNLTAIAHKRRIPLALVNARLSPRSESRFRTFNRFVRPYFQKLDLICVQEPEDVGRWQSLGVKVDRIRLVGSIKFDPEGKGPDPSRPRGFLKTISLAEKRPILLAGSTHPGEEEIIGRAFLDLRHEFPELFLIIAPRHVERARDIATQLETMGLATTYRSDSNIAAARDCLLLDTTGELRDWYGVAAVVFIGKSLASRGGQNPVEPIVAERPVVFGPHMENFVALTRALLAVGGAVEVNELSLTTTIAALLRDPAKRADLVRNALNVLDHHRGATARTAELLIASGLGIS